MNRNARVAVALIATAPAFAFAETFEETMLNKGQTAAMVSEPRFVSVEIGTTVTFLPVDKGHNAETFKGTMREDHELFKGKTNQKVSADLTTEGMIGLECKPHLGMGMVMQV